MLPQVNLFIFILLLKVPLHSKNYIRMGREKNHNYCSLSQFVSIYRLALKYPLLSFTLEPGAPVNMHVDQNCL